MGTTKRASKRARRGAPSRKKALSTDREIERELRTMPNVGRAMAEDLMRLGVRSIAELKRRSPRRMYDQISAMDGVRHDPCVLDTFIAAVRYVEGAPARPWWKYTAQRKRTLAARKPPNPA